MVHYGAAEVKVIKKRNDVCSADVNTTSKKTWWDGTWMAKTGHKLCLNDYYKLHLRSSVQTGVVKDPISLVNVPILSLITLWLLVAKIPVYRTYMPFHITNFVHFNNCLSCTFNRCSWNPSFFSHNISLQIADIWLVAGSVENRMYFR